MELQAKANSQIQTAPASRGGREEWGNARNSGGQTGADGARPDFAIETSLEHGGYVPRGRKAEDGRIDDKYNLVELSTNSYL
jgi:hypothetical protein